MKMDPATSTFLSGQPINSPPHAMSKTIKGWVDAPPNKKGDKHTGLISSVMNAPFHDAEDPIAASLVFTHDRLYTENEVRAILRSIDEACPFTAEQMSLFEKFNVTLT